MTAERFYHELVQKTAESENCNKEKYGEPSQWTQAITKIIQTILSDNLSEVSSDSGTEIGTSKEYYRIDVTSWIQQKDSIREACKKVEMDPHLWQLQTAVEHENESEKWFDEVCKLSFIRCPLRVVIGYGIENADEKINIVKDILHRTNAFTDADQEFVVILGVQKDRYPENSSNPCGYRLWVLKQNEENIICSQS